ncbi:helix-turn-helix transcriptional regulator [Actinomadura scrupuli]|uniref:helix-turn-helix transcriptional regulator n=1 Tax=Actinomadura scrupuli TaxID=559629 RepID=UPI003D95F530
MRASRLLSLLLLLQTRGRMTAQRLADELQVSVRTIYRDVESLSAAGVPVYADRGPDGGYQLLDGYRTRLTGLTTDEAGSLFLAGMPGPAAALGLGAELAATELKLLAALPPELRSRAGRIRERFHLDAPTWFREPEQVPHLTAVADAVWNQRRIQIRYERWSQPRLVTRTLDPLGLVIKAGHWYLIARSQEVVRTYRAVRILEVEPLGERFSRPEDFDLVAFWTDWAERFEAGVYRAEAVVRLSPEGLCRTEHLLPIAMARAARATAGPPDEDGWVQATIPIESLRHAHGDLLKLGSDVEVLDPLELREAIAQTVRELTKIYDG